MLPTGHAAGSGREAEPAQVVGRGAVLVAVGERELARHACTVLHLGVAADRGVRADDRVASDDGAAADVRVHAHDGALGDDRVAFDPSARADPGAPLHFGTGVDVGRRVDERAGVDLGGRGDEAPAVHVLPIATQDPGFVLELDIADAHVLLLPVRWFHTRTLIQHRS